VEYFVVSGTWVDGLSNELSAGETGSQILLMVIKHSHLIVLLVNDITGNSPRILLHSDHDHYSRLQQVAVCDTCVGSQCTLHSSSVTDD